MKTKVRIIGKDSNSVFKIGDVGYIDGYAQLFYGDISAIVVVGNKICNIDLESLEVLHIK